MKRFMVFDWESYSDSDLSEVGAFEYSMHPSTDMICLGFAIGTLDDFKEGAFEVHSWSPLLRDRNLKSLVMFESALRDRDMTLVAHNAFFDAMITKNVFFRRSVPQPHPELRWSRFRCTSAMCLSAGLPRKLEDAAMAMELIEQKDKEGNRLVKKWCKPRKPTATNEATRHLDMVHQSDKALGELKRIIEYCKSDIRVTAELFSKLPFLTDSEQKLWELTQKVNMRGFRIDRPFVKKVLELIDVEGLRLERRLSKITKGAVESASQLPAMKRWAAAEGFAMGSMAKESITEALASPETPENVRRVLAIRQSGGRTSTAKYARCLDASNYDGRARGGLVYHSAITGRWAGALINPQNFPRGTIGNSTKALPPGTALMQAVDIVKSGDNDLVRLIYGDAMSVYSSCLRAVVIPSEGHVFDVADYSQIEARVLLWMSGHKRALDIFRDKSRDIYVEQAAIIYGVPTSEVGPDKRFVGKEAVLGCGFQLGWKKIQLSLKSKGVVVSDEFAQKIIKAYRRMNVPVVNMWGLLERAAIKATLSPGRVFEACRCSYVSDGDFLYCTLPSGRRITYQTPKVSVEMKYGEKRHVLYHWKVDTRTKKRVYGATYGGKLTENVVQGTARDVMANAKLNIEASKIWKLILSVHDEVISERPIDSNATIDEYVKIMKRIPKWAEGLPVEAEGWTGDRYRK